jgi:hypothetical protein
MAITRARTSSVAQGPTTRKTISGGNDIILPGGYESIATTTVGSGGQSTVTFSSIQTSWTHLQLRIFAKTNRALNRDGILITINSDSGNNYTAHGLYGDGANPFTDAGTARTSNIVYRASGNSGATDIFGTMIIDFLNYKDTNKYKTLRSLGGVDLNGSGEVNFYSGLWLNSNAITSISLAPAVGTSFLQHSQFDLYGIK